jgi:pimeloyl-ACP methyl ester carboxylesterase
MKALFPNVRRITVKGAGHWVHTDAPTVVTEALRRFARIPAH